MNFAFEGVHAVHEFAVGRLDAFGVFRDFVEAQCHRDAPHNAARVERLISLFEPGRGRISPKTPRGGLEPPARSKSLGI